MRTLLTPLLIAGFGPLAAAQVVVDGDISADNYGSAWSVQAVETGFGDNKSELNAAYATVEAGRLYLALTGNIEDNFNKLEIFIDSVAGGENVFSGVPGNDGAGVMTGMTFDSGFEADYHLILRRGFDAIQKFDVDIAILGTANFSSYIDVFGGVFEGSGVTGTGAGNAFPIEVGYDDSNTAGVEGGDGAANQTNALAVTTGVELSIDLADLGNPAGPIKILAFVNGSGHNYASNQFLGALAPPQPNLGGDGFGNFTGTLTVDLNTFAGEQFFVFDAGIGTNYCAVNANSTGNPAIMSAEGSAEIALNDFTLYAQTVPAQPGLFFSGVNAIEVPFGNSYLCAAGGIVRYNPPSLPSGDVASRVIDLNAQGILPGTLNFQYWFRDPAGGGSSFSTSDGLAVLFY